MARALQQTGSEHRVVQVGPGLSPSEEIAKVLDIEL